MDRYFKKLKKSAEITPDYYKKTDNIIRNEWNYDYGKFTIGNGIRNLMN